MKRLIGIICSIKCILIVSPIELSELNGEMNGECEVKLNDPFDTEYRFKVSFIAPVSFS